MESLEKTSFGNSTVVFSDDASLNIGGRVLEIKKGKKTDMIFHIDYNKIIYVLSGKIKGTAIRNGKISSVEFVSGKSFVVKRGVVHSYEAIEDAVIIEFSNNHSLFDNGGFTCVFPGEYMERIEKGKEEKNTDKQISTKSKSKPKSKKKSKNESW